MPVMDKLTSHDATIVILKCMIASTERLFNNAEEFKEKISLEEIMLLQEARDRQVARLKENLMHAIKIRG